MRFLGNTPEQPVVEEWAWQTDVLTSTDGTEQRISLTPVPKRELNVRLTADTEAEVSALTRAAYRSGAGLLIPFYHSGTKLTASAGDGAGNVSFDASRTDVRSGQEAVIYDEQGRIERVTLAVVSAGGATLVNPLADGWRAGAFIAPVWAMVGAGGLMSVSRHNPDYIAEISIGLKELGFIEPFLGEHVDATLPLFNGYPVLNLNAVGSDFDHQYDTGASLIDYGMTVEIRDLWRHPQVSMARQFLCQRVFDPDSWAFWRTFADYARGSTNPFYLPTFRDDFEAVALPVAGAGSVTFVGDEYDAEFADFEPFKQFAFFMTDGTTHFASVTNSILAGGNSQVTFAPAIPAGKVVRKICLLLKVRIADDRVSCEHEALHTTISLTLRTAD